MKFLVKTLLLLCLAWQIQGTEVESKTDLHIQEQADASLLITTKYGQIHGKNVQVKETDQSVNAFYGIPFAKPPVGPLRFAPPQKVEPWSSIIDTTQNPPMCLQNKKLMEHLMVALDVDLKLPIMLEDCLYLNIFAPRNREKNTKLPVMVSIHGGGLTMGGAFMFDGSALSAYENVIIVVIQYRLGILGFLSTGDEQAPGNLGFLDQVAALEWVQENIEDFGGDKHSVTIFGESAGGLSVSALVVSPLSKGLFHRAISGSGVVLFPGLVATKVEETKNTIGKISSCDPVDSSVLVECLKKKSKDEIVEIIIKMSELLHSTVSIDGFFLPKPAEEIYAAKDNHRVPYLLGVTNHEFAWILVSALNISGLNEGMSKEKVHTTLRNYPLFSHVSEVLPLIMEEYFDTEDPLEIRDNFLDLCGDMVFVLPTINVATYHRDSGAPVYLYEFQHRPSIFHKSKPDFVKADHGDDMFFVNGGPFLHHDILFKGNATDEEKVLSKTMMKYWANFARNGNPNGPGLVQWPEFDKDEDYLEIGLKQKSSKKLKEERVKFWTITLPEKVKKIQEEKKDQI